jgi:hypothetical protein
MAIKTVGELVDDILSAMDSDPVTLYDDTVESRQVAQILETVYYQIIDGKDWPNLYSPFRLTQTGVSTPTHLTIPSGVMDIKYIKYDCKDVDDTKDKYTEIKWMEPKPFMDMLDARDSSATEIDQITDTSSILLNIYNDRAPVYYTSFDEQTIIMDSYDSAVETYLKTAKTQCYGKVYPTVTMADDFIFDLPPDAFSLLLAEAKAVAFAELKQIQNPKAEQFAVTQRRRMSQEAWRIRNGISYPNYGRSGVK